MTAHELAQELLSHPDIPVILAYNSGDYWRTVVAEDVDSNRPQDVEFSEYHQKHKVVHLDDGDFNEGVREVLILS